MSITFSNHVTDLITMEYARSYLALLFCICMAVSWTGLREIDRRIETSRGFLIVSAMIETGDRIEAYINADYTSPLVTPIVPDIKTDYSIGPIFKILRSLRIDLGKRNGSKIEVSGVELFSGNKSIQKWSAEDIRRSVASQPGATTAAPEIVDGAVRYVQKGEGPYLILDPPAILADVSQFGLLERSVVAFRGRNGVLAGAVLGFFLLLVVTIRRERSLVTILVSGVAILQTVFLILYLLPRINIPDPVAIAVGRAAFLGRSTLANQLTMLAALAGAVIIAVGASAIVKQIRKLKLSYIEWSGPARGPLDERHPVANWASRAAVIVFCGLLAAYFLSNVYSAILTQITTPFSGNWDANNVLLWNYLAHEGFRPLVDYWYPYGGTWMFALKAPWGPFVENSYYSALYINLFLALYLVFDRRFLSAAIVTLIVLIGQTDMLFWAAFRYLLAVNVVLSFVVVPHHRWSAAHLLFTASVGLAIVFEPIQCLYALPGVFFCMLIDFWQCRRDSVRKHAVRLAREFGPPAVVICVYLAILASQGMLEGFVDFHLSLGAATFASATPTDLPGSLRSLLGASSFVIVAPFVMIAIAIVRLRTFDLTTDNIDRALLGLGLTGFMIVQKHIIREVEWQMVLPSGIAVMIWALREAEFRRWVPIAASGLVSGALFFAASTDGVPQRVMRQLAGAPESLASHFNEVVQVSGLSREANSAAYSDKRLAAFANERKVVDRLDALGRRENNATVYVLGDSPTLYVLLRQAPPFQSNDYNASPVPEQQKVVSWLRNKRPAFVVWRTGDLEFDMVPRVVRDPYIYSEVVANYVPIEQTGEFSILRLRRDDELPALDWWREKLTPTVNLGHLLHGSRMTASPACPIDTATRCAKVIKIDLTKQSRGTDRIAAKVVLGNLTFEVQFSPDQDKQSYLIPIERLWFWKAAEISGLTSQAEIEVSTPAVSEIQFKLRSNNSLY
jgi:hypothetical protein